MGTSKHQRLVDNLEKRLLDKHYYWNVIKNKHYRVVRGCGVIRGEFDVLTYRDGFWHYYEVKSNHSSKNFRRACVQFERVSRAYPGEAFRFVYVTPQCVRRYRPK